MVYLFRVFQHTLIRLVVYKSNEKDERVDDKIAIERLKNLRLVTATCGFQWMKMIQIFKTGLQLYVNF